jgi:hypothetical protein
MRKFVNFGTLAILLALLFSSCGNDTVVIEDNISDSTSTNINEEPIIKAYQKYKFPSPLEIFVVLKDEGVKFNSNFLNDLERVNTYTTTEKLAIGMGIYSSDLAYCSMYEKSQLTMNYFAVNKSIADKLGLAQGFDKGLMERIDKNINNADSLIRLTSNSYTEAVSFLEENGQTKILPYIIFGEWIESAYITVSLTKTYSVDDIGVNVISEQSLLFENIYDYFNKASIKESNEALYNDVESLYLLYIELYNNETEEITETQFNNIKAKITEIRNNWI